MAYPLALLITRSKKRFQNLMVLLVVLPFASNFLIRIYAWMIILGPESALSHVINTTLGILGIAPVTLLFSPFAVLVGMVYVHLPFMVLPLYTNLEKHDLALLDAAQDLGASGWQRFWKVTWPMSLPGVLAGSALVFIPVLGMFAIPEMLGGTGDILIGNLIKDQFLGTRDWPFGSTLSILLTLTVLAIAGFTAWIARRLGGMKYAE
jgi:spermidine/putrescine transport system permease protein